MGADATAARNGILGFDSDMLGITSGISVGGSAADSITVNGVSIGPYSLIFPWTPRAFRARANGTDVVLPSKLDSQGLGI